MCEDYMMEEENESSQQEALMGEIVLKLKFEKKIDVDWAYVEYQDAELVSSKGLSKEELGFIGESQEQSDTYTVDMVSDIWNCLSSMQNEEIALKTIKGK